MEQCKKDDPDKRSRCDFYYPSNISLGRFSIKLVIVVC